MVKNITGRTFEKRRRSGNPAADHKKSYKSGMKIVSEDQRRIKYSLTFLACMTNLTKTT